MDKAWVWLPRASREYEQGAKQFVTDSTRLLGNPVEMLCPCIACRNVCHQVIETVIDHLIIKGMDRKYKRNACWSHHGDVRKLNDVVRLLAGKNCPDLASQSGVSDVSKGGIKCQLLDWYAVDDVVVGEAELCSAEPSYKIGRIPLGPDALAVIVKSVLKPEASLWRPTKTHSSIGEALGEQIAWPEDRVIFKDINKTAGSSATNGNESIRRYTIFDWKKVDCAIAEGVMLSNDPMEMVNDIPLGPNAVILSVDFVLKPDAYLWRPSEDKSTIGEAVNTNIAWPLHKIELLNPPTPTESVTKTAATASNSTNNSNANPKKKCIMFDSNNSGRIVAEGQLLSSNPADSIHCAPLGPNASKVMVQVPIIGDAGVWRPTSETQFISDAVGTIVAWPNDKLKFV